MNESVDNVQRAILGNTRDFTALRSLSCLLKTKSLTRIIIRRKDNEKTEDLGNT